jgi:hypothetical protein
VKGCDYCPPWEISLWEDYFVNLEIKLSVKPLGATLSMFVPAYALSSTILLLPIRNKFVTA